MLAFWHLKNIFKKLSHNINGNVFKLQKWEIRFSQKLSFSPDWWVWLIFILELFDRKDCFKCLHAMTHFFLLSLFYVCFQVLGFFYDLNSLNFLRFSFERQNLQREKGRHTHTDLLPTGSLHKKLWWLGLSQAEARDLELQLGLPRGCQGPRLLGHPLLPSQAH